MSYGITFTGTDALTSLLSLATLGVFGTLIALTIAAGLGRSLIAVLGDLFVKGED